MMPNARAILDALGRLIEALFPAPNYEARRYTATRRLQQHRMRAERREGRSRARAILTRPR